jgi:hypothetical protein
VTYLAGISFGGVNDRQPAIHCDEAGCEARVVINYPPPSWFLHGNPKRGWTIIRCEDGPRLDYCPEHGTPKEKPAATPREKG